MHVVSYPDRVHLLHGALRSHLILSRWHLVQEKQARERLLITEWGEEALDAVSETPSERLEDSSGDVSEVCPS
jgi:hypothetical protein